MPSAPVDMHGPCRARLSRKTGDGCKGQRKGGRMKRDETRQPVTAEVVRQARTFLRTERHGALAVLDPETGAPLVSRVSLASDPSGALLILISQLSAHFGALVADRRCAVLLGSPGKGDPLAYPRMSVSTEAHRLEGAERDRARGRFLARHPKAALYAGFADFAFWRLVPVAAALNGGFAKAYDLDAADLVVEADPQLVDIEPGAVEHMNDDHLDAIKLYAEVLAGAPEGDWRLATLDVEGMDMTCGDRVARLWFDPPLRSAEELRPRLVALAKRARAAGSGSAEQP